MRGLVLLFISGVFCSISAQPRPCESPAQYVGSMSMTAADGIITSAATYSYDAHAQQIRVRNYMTIFNETILMDLLMHFKQGVMYEIDYSRLRCEKKALETSFHPTRVPADAAFMGQVILGTTSVAGLGLLTNSWVGEIPEIQAQYMLTFAEFTCLPISASVFTPQTGWITMSFYNHLLGVQNPQDFVPPFFCPASASDEHLPKTNFLKAVRPSPSKDQDSSRKN
ncbi:ependymin-like [Megalobrama amblycephala]|uniref:ependymin-like n=1 Tax=Megalobrama amblycephala TaxID=75352 RepID=UPI0020140CE3|nr:ependymin-like [Megalobrama amblycephala]